MPPKSTRSLTRSPRLCTQSDAPACESDVQVPTADLKHCPYRVIHSRRLIHSPGFASSLCGGIVALVHTVEVWAQQLAPSRHGSGSTPLSRRSTLPTTCSAARLRTC